MNEKEVIRGKSVGEWFWKHNHVTGLRYTSKHVEKKSLKERNTRG